jgi:hypothetical protein
VNTWVPGPNPTSSESRSGIFSPPCPVVNRGGGTSLSGKTVNYAGNVSRIVIALTALAALGLSGAPFHETFHVNGGQ